ncbi:hypothetical protein JMN10_05525 [Capnocytophaga genosp. AHN8471]|uniref:Uncharacterized protein n=1 Tax=Capnocytophaga genosp. AHN8471 TaxID=327574 RepID=A0ABS1YX26_9FLAO|nr:hypothetical protein [Capnocytophaga genosp. AHN8471]MBM0650970.1 hypothetical protein [Capnocytophaga genosp. AHN8471]MBM0661648.1 hypothetical protein [Capnocytophaga genosp. AHN8471]
MDENFIKFSIASLFLVILAAPIVLFYENKEKNTIYEVKLSDNTIIRDTLYNKNDCFEDKYGKTYYKSNIIYSKKLSK